MPDPPSILIVDDDETMRDACRESLRSGGHHIEEALSGEAAVELLGARAFDVVLVDLKMPGMGGMELLRWLRTERAAAAAVVITGYGTVDLAVEAMKLGAAEFLCKPFTPQALRDAVRDAAQNALAMPPSLVPSESGSVPGGQSSEELVGSSRAMIEIKALLERVGPTDSTVLVTGESGTGKEVVARTIRDLSPRRDKPFVVVDCGALVGTLFESELFGHVRGSFTGATATKHGRLELADGGTIFFDEIGNVAPEIQAKLLRLIQEREFTRVGSTQVIRPDVRIIAATSKNLDEEIRAGRFRQDLYYRLCVVPIVLPPLRERAGDIPLLAEHFLGTFCCRAKRLRFSDEAMGLLLSHPWPGNVRELRNTVERACILARGETIVPKDLMWLAAGVDVEQPPPIRLSDVEREHVERMLAEHGGNLSATARALGIDRKTLRRKLKPR